MFAIINPKEHRSLSKEASRQVKAGKHRRSLDLYQLHLDSQGRLPRPILERSTFLGGILDKFLQILP